mmetsp:Transcript_1288/g.1802  ORF Transcript_1288/g.1802 Transcript_1288/m.1802 type:complete len:387 (-) Transcript_1288:235-1395(-)
METLKLMLSAGVDINQHHQIQIDPGSSNLETMRVVDYAYHLGHYDFVEVFIHAGADIRGLFDVALKKKDRKLVRMLRSSEHFDAKSQSALSSATLKGDVGAMKILLEVGVSVNDFGYYDRRLISCSLGCAIRWGKRSAVELLLEYGALFDWGIYGNALWLSIVKNRNWGCFYSLLRAGVLQHLSMKNEAHVLYLTHALAWASSMNEIEVMKVLLQHQVPINTVTFTLMNYDEHLDPDECCGMTPLLAASIHKAKDAVSLLLESGADPNLFGTLYPTNPLLAIASSCDSSHAFEIMNLLLEARANPNVLNSDDGSSPLILVAKQENRDSMDGDHWQCQAVASLYRYGADLNAETKSGDTALIFATRNDNRVLCQTLLQLGADATGKI